jgi:hypothetical protein
MTEPIFIAFFISNLLDLTVCFKENPPQDFSYQIALLDRGQYSRVSHLARVGDALCSFIDRKACFVFRFRKRCQLDVDESRIIQQDFEEHGDFRGIRERHKPKVQHVLLIEFCAGGGQFRLYIVRQS